MELSDPDIKAAITDVPLMFQENRGKHEHAKESGIYLQKETQIELLQKNSIRNRISSMLHISGKKEELKPEAMECMYPDRLWYLESILQKERTEIVL